MPRFFFHLRDDLDVPDLEGSEFPTLVDAYCHALRGARELMSEDLMRCGKIALGHRIEIADESRKVLKTVLFSEAVMVEN